METPMPLARIRKRLFYAHGFARAAIRNRRQRPRQEMAPAPHRPDPATWPNDRLTLSWLGHATVLMNFYGRWLVTDPALRSRIGVSLGLATLGPRRLIHPALTPRELPPLDMVLVSHAHMDHLDLPTLRRIQPSTPAVTQRGVGDLLRRFSNVTELEWGEETMVGGVRVGAIPARHWGARLMTDTHRGYGGFLLEYAGGRVLFAGDTAYTDLYRQFRDRGPIDVAIVPIGAYDPWIANHASPEEAWAMSRDMGAEYVVPIHHSTFRLSREPIDEPLQRLLAVAGDEAWRVVVREVGETWEMRR
jgi:L-ascorbate metabolism protein UlaG (beta-lactamase superfamily)